MACSNTYKTFEISFDIDTGLLNCFRLNLSAKTWDELRKLIDADLRRQNSAKTSVVSG